MHRILFQWGALTIYSYGFMLAVAFMVGIYLAQQRGKKQGIGAQLIFDLIFYILIASIVGARFLFVSINWAYYKEHLLEIVKLWEGGLVFYGGFILALPVVFLFLRKHRLPFRKIADILSPSLAIGFAIGRIGCFLNGCCYGKVSGQWGVSYPSTGNPPAFAQQVFDGLLGSGAHCSLPVIPTQLYESLSGIAIFLILLTLEKHRRFEGFLFWMFLLLFSVSRFIVESFRQYEQNFLLSSTFTVSQLISALLAFLALFFLQRGYRFFRLAGRKG